MDVAGVLSEATDAGKLADSMAYVNPASQAFLHPLRIVSLQIPRRFCEDLVGARAHGELQILVLG